MLEFCAGILLSCFPSVPCWTRLGDWDSADRFCWTEASRMFSNVKLFRILFRFLCTLLANTRQYREAPTSRPLGGIYTPICSKRLCEKRDARIYTGEFEDLPASRRYSASISRITGGFARDDQVDCLPWVCEFCFWTREKIHQTPATW